METSVMPHTAPGSLGSLSFLAWTALKGQAKVVFPSISGAAHGLFRDFGSVFSMKQENLPQECSATSPKISKGLMALQSIAGRGTQNSEKKTQSTRQSLSKSTQAVGCFYCKEPGEEPTIATRHSLGRDQIKKLTKHNGFVAEMEDMRKAFLMRPGCPQFSTRTTSVSHVGSATMVDLPGTCSGVWKTEDLGRQGSAGSVDGQLFPFSKSACELYYPRKKSEPPALSPTGSPTVVKKSQRTRMPWYISVIHEKDHSLLLMGEELQRYSEMETQMQKKDQEILTLQKEKEALKKQLKNLLRSKGTETSSASIRMTPLKLGRMSVLKTIYKEEDELQRWMQMQEEYNLAESSKELHLEPGSTSEEKSPEGPPEEPVPAKLRASQSKTGILLEVSTEEEEEEAKGTEEEELSVDVDEEEELWELREEEERRPKRSYSMTESFEEELMAQLEEYERMLMDFQSELEFTRSRYSLATGAITSLQRQTDFQESQLRKVTTENELLEKELRERKKQIQEMTDKVVWLRTRQPYILASLRTLSVTSTVFGFPANSLTFLFSNLREEKKHQEIMGLIEKENLVLRQQVADLKTELVNSEQTIEELNTQTKELEDQVNTDKDHLRRWKELHDDLQARNEMIQQAEQQTRVVLEATQARKLEKLRNKIIQAVFSVSGTKNLSTELSDSHILESLQRIISERSDFYSQLKQKGVKVPPLQQSDVSLPTKIKKMLSK
ncbi:Coiled-coil domain-containing protein 27 [Apodemus speciosus]|uniref:Coiled-coil domain-containing protein 27 n=1 Tax=Apodemus speciosus TaxID=105296 RepID=A0ABQ0EQK3_APOSI